MKIWVDECLTPTLVGEANGRAEDWAFFTNNESDFVELLQAIGVHTGLVVLPQAGGRQQSWPLFHAAIDYIEERSRAAGESPADWMINKHVQVDVGGTVTHTDLPPA